MISLTKSSCSSSINWFILQTLCPSHSFTLSCDWFSWCACTAAPSKTSSGSYLKAPRAIELSAHALPPEDLSPVTAPLTCLALPIFHLSEVREAMLNFSCSETKHINVISSHLFFLFYRTVGSTDNPGTPSKKPEAASSPRTSGLGVSQTSVPATSTTSISISINSPKGPSPSPRKNRPKSWGKISGKCVEIGLLLNILLFNNGGHILLFKKWKIWTHSMNGKNEYHKISLGYA